MTTVLDHKLSVAIKERSVANSIASGVRPLPSEMPDFFSNDYLSVSMLPELQDGLRKQVQTSERLLGSRGSRSLQGTTNAHIELERLLCEHYDAAASMLSNTGYNANISFLGGVPQLGDVLIHDELVHASCYDGMRMSRAKDSMYSFKHNSLSSLDECITCVLNQHPQIAAGKSTVFFIVESIYSMDGDLCPLVEMLDLVENRVPQRSRHFFIDEAHSHGIIGPQGRGLAAHLGVSHRIQTRMLSFTKGHCIVGAIIFTSQIICDYMVNFARSVMFSTAMAYIDVIAIKHLYEAVRGRVGDDLRSKLQRRCFFFLHTLTDAFKDIPPELLSLKGTSGVDAASGLLSPIFPLLSSKALSLHYYLQTLGYGSFGITFPVVPRGQDRIRVVIHAGNTEEEMRDFIATVKGWALWEMGHYGSSHMKVDTTEHIILASKL